MFHYILFYSTDRPIFEAATMDDIPDMSTPNPAPRRKRPALVFDSPERASKRLFVEPEGRPVSDRDSCGGVEANGAAKSSDGKDKEPEANDKQVEAPGQAATLCYSTMQSRHLKTEPDGLDDTEVFVASNMLCQSPGHDDTLTLQSPCNAEASFVTAKTTLGASAASSPKPAFKMRPSIGKLSWQALFETSTAPSPFDPENFRSLPPL